MKAAPRRFPVEPLYRIFALTPQQCPTRAAPLNRRGGSQEGRADVPSGPCGFLLAPAAPARHTPGFAGPPRSTPLRSFFAPSATCTSGILPLAPHRAAGPRPAGRAVCGILPPREAPSRRPRSRGRLSGPPIARVIFLQGRGGRRRPTPPYGCARVGVSRPPRPVRRRPGGGAVAALAALFDHPRLSRPAWDARTTPISDPRSSTSEAPLQRTHRPTPGPARRTNTNGGKERQPRQEDNNRKNPENPEQKGLLPKNNARHRAGRLAPLPRTCPERTQPRRRLVPARLPVRPTSGGDAAAVDAPRSRARHAATPPSAALTRLAPGPHRAAARLAPRRANARLRASCPADRAAILAASALLASSPRLSRPLRTRPAEPPPETA